MADLANIQTIQQKVENGILNGYWDFNYTSQDMWSNNPYYEINGNAQSKDARWTVDIENLCGHNVYFSVKKDGEIIYELNSSAADEENLTEHYEITELIQSCLDT
ncbi:MAG: hypothetical protein ACHBN1_11665 [Heteroscytonema crispum UTEX LB 1556]